MWLKTLTKILTMTLVMMIGLAGCGGLSSSGATIYEYDNKQWLVTSYSSVDQGEGLFSQSTSRTVALRQPNGTFRIVVSSSFSDGEGQSQPNVTINSTIQRDYVRGSTDPVGDLIGLIARDGTAISRVNPTSIVQNGRSYSFPENAKTPISAQAEMSSDY